MFKDLAQDSLNINTIEARIRQVRVRMEVLSGLCQELKYEDDTSPARVAFDRWQREREELKELLDLEEKVLLGGYDVAD